ncbi:uncharacterized protein B0H18DRAFT_1037005 [Fomitopsis serialis]|uniref:uncharacterized protein n=1 Tax=Fomitopsis serialis TaxID=139415 RepID=UPI0020089202|nr:uncharacterized protein B0H18DRAFT_1037005 [Neoantrodia serialis]KAH9916840.1 hypothetical protein B0H18DRAFT_1037005 [Neoantrodia serialis]
MVATKQTRYPPAPSRKSDPRGRAFPKRATRNAKRHEVLPTVTRYAPFVARVPRIAS